MNTIRFQDKEFKIRGIEIPEFGNVLISTTSLNELLLNGNESYTSDEAIAVDESIYYFVEENEMEFTDDELFNLLLLEIR